MSANWGLDQLRIRKNAVFIIGWLFASFDTIEQLHLVLRDDQGLDAGSIRLETGQTRNDVLRSHPDQPQSRDCGFLGAGIWQRPPRPGYQLLLEARLSSGRTMVVLLPQARWEWCLQASGWKHSKGALRHWFVTAKRAVLLLMGGQWRGLVTKVRRQRRQLSSALQSALRPGQGWTQLLKHEASAERRTHLIVDHRLGGGANHYRQRLVASLLADGDSVLTWMYDLATLQPMLLVEEQQNRRTYALENETDLVEMLKDIPLTSITYNNAVSFVEAETIPALLLELHQRSGARLTVLLHDYFAICPSHVLLSHQGRFCAIPDLETCRSCLPNNPNGFTSLFRGDVLSWRRAWGPLLTEATEIVAFSESSAALLRKAYETWPDGDNWLKGRRIEVRPHEVTYLGNQTVIVSQTDKLVIGVVGHISFHKGARVLKQLSNEILSQQSQERIVVIGSFEGASDERALKQTGPYRQENLAEVIKRSGANIMLFPSICPETFSYVTHELISLGLPLACFDLGAPAERVLTYEKGLILESQEPEAILRALRSFFLHIYRPSQSSPATAELTG